MQPDKYPKPKGKKAQHIQDDGYPPQLNSVLDCPFFVERYAISFSLKSQFQLGIQN